MITVVPLATRKAAPRRTVSAPKVTINGGKSSRAIEAPLTKPRSNPVSKAAGLKPAAIC